MTTVLKSPIDDRTPAQKALTNSLILQKIMQNADSMTLKSCRSLCKMWQEEATKQLLTSRHNQFLEVKFRWSDDNGEYKHSSHDTLQAFIDFCFKKSRLFPCVKFSFGGGYLNSPAFFNFFKDFGTKVKFLRLSPITINEGEISLAVKSLGVVLFKLAPNLEGLALSSSGWTGGKGFPKNVSATISSAGGGGRRKWTKGQIYNIPRTLPNLKKVILSMYRTKFPNDDSEMDPVVLNILRAAPNLNHLEDESLYFTREIVAAGKFGLIKHLGIMFDCPGPEGYRRDTRLRFFSEQNPQLETISLCRFTGFDDATATAHACLTSILRSSKYTLKNIHGLHAVDFEHCQLPQLENVTSLSLKPNTCVDYEFSHLPETMKAVCSSFPNLETLRIHVYLLSKWRYVSKMDAAFTGLPLSLCKDLKKHPSQTLDDRILKSLPGNGQPSIRDLTKLKELENCMEQMGTRVRIHRICTRVSDLYAFDLMKHRQGLKVSEVVRYRN